MARVTIQDVAAAASVSPSTVSNFLNGRLNRMVPATRERIETAIDQLGYRPNAAARQLRTGRTETIGLIVPSVANPFWGAFAHQLEIAALAVGRSVLLCNSERDADRERRYVEELWQNGVRGIVLCSSLPSLDHLGDLIARGLQLVTFDRLAQPDDPASVVSIGIDNVAGGFAAASHLIDLGHRRLSYVSGSRRSVNRTGRYLGFCTALESAGLDVATMPNWPSLGTVPYGDVEPADLGRRAVHDLFSAAQERPTGIVALNDMTALGVCRGLRDLGLTVGGQVSVVGFDDIVLADLYDPPLTTIRQPIAQMAKLSVAAAASRAGGIVDENGRSVLFRPELIVRASTAPPPSLAAWIDATSVRAAP